MRPNRALILAVVLIAGGGLPWLASVESLKLLDNQSGLPLLAGQTLTMPLVALTVWLVVRRLWPQLSRLAAIALILGIWLVPSVWILLTDTGNTGKPMIAGALPSFLAVGPAILSVYLLNSIGLVATLASLSIAAMWRMRDTSSARLTRGCSGRLRRR